jgi:chorismate mutase
VSTIVQELTAARERFAEQLAVAEAEHTAARQRLADASLAAELAEDGKPPKAAAQALNAAAVELDRLRAALDAVDERIVAAETQAELSERRELAQRYAAAKDRQHAAVVEIADALSGLAGPAREGTEAGREAAKLALELGLPDERTYTGGLPTGHLHTIMTAQLGDRHGEGRPAGSAVRESLGAVRRPWRRPGSAADKMLNELDL